MKYAVTVATGHFGERVVLKLLTLVSFNDIVVIARDVEKAKQMYPTAVEIRQGDYDDEKMMEKAFAGIDRVLFVSSQPNARHPRLAQHQNVVTAAANAGVKYLAYTSFPHADTSDAPLAKDHRATEKMIIDARIPHSFLRNNWYLENELPLIKAAQAGEPFIYATGEETVGWAEEIFYAEGAAKVMTMLEQDPLEVYEFHGAQHTYKELAKAIQEATGKTFPVQAVDLAQYQADLAKTDLDAAQINFKVAMQKLIASGALNERVAKKDVAFGMTHEQILENNINNENALENVLGMPLPSLSAQVKDLLANKPKYLI
ncbi:NmrA family NAD(P)-binding protein [Fructilactobacillus frigidiflavus]|uniref:NAD(P)H-binding protein n=1 Tax=Fructilactobacillus frigidiflavus TaxID=3242688 RepID=UPI0037576617